MRQQARGTASRQEIPPRHGSDSITRRVLKRSETTSTDLGRFVPLALNAAQVNVVIW
jgi:hypothetical protein